MPEQGDNPDLIPFMRRFRVPAGMREQGDQSDVIAFMRRFRLQALWGAAAAVALAAAVFSSQSQVGAQRMTAVLASITGSGQKGAPLFDAETATRQLAQAVQDLRKDRDRLAARLAAVEQDMDDMTGSISKQIDAAKATAQAAAPWPSGEPTAEETSAALVATLSPSAVATAMALSADPLAPAAAASPFFDAASAESPTAYGADIASSTSIKTLQAHWAALRSAHPRLFEGLRPSLALRESSRSNRTELRLVVGPFATVEAAAQLCIALSAFRQPCQPTMYGGQIVLQ